jgi:hypothetical protein
VYVLPQPVCHPSPQASPSLSLVSFWITLLITKVIAVWTLPPTRSSSLVMSSPTRPPSLSLSRIPSLSPRRISSFWTALTLCRLLLDRHKPLWLQVHLFATLARAPRSPSAVLPLARARCSPSAVLLPPPHRHRWRLTPRCHTWPPAVCLRPCCHTWTPMARLRPRCHARPPTVRLLLAPPPPCANWVPPIRDIQ